MDFSFICNLKEGKRSNGVHVTGFFKHKGGRASREAKSEGNAPRSERTPKLKIIIKWEQNIFFRNCIKIFSQHKVGPFVKGSEEWRERSASRTHSKTKNRHKMKTKHPFKKLFWNFLLGILFSIRLFVKGSEKWGKRSVGRTHIQTLNCHKMITKHPFKKLPRTVHLGIFFSFL